MDVLAKRLAHQALNSKSGIGIKLAPGADRIPCLLFADDSLLFCKATSQAAFNLKTIFSQNLDRIYREFFWKKSNSEKGLPMVAWDKIC